MHIQNEDMDFNIAYFLNRWHSLELIICMITWTSKRLVMFLNKLSSATVFFRFDHTLAADIRGVTEASSSNRTSGEKQRITY